MAASVGPFTTSPRASRPGARRILVVDDMPVVREPIAACLRAAGYETILAVDAHDALERIAAGRPDLIILDVHMPGMDGLQMLALLRTRPETVSLPVILLTTETDRLFVQRASSLGVRDYLLKSEFSLPDLVERVARHLSDRPKDDGDAQADIAADARSHFGDKTAQADVATPAAAIPVMAPKPALSSLAPVANRDDLLSRAERAFEGRTLSGVVAQVISLAASPRVGTADLAALIVRDPTLSANVLKVANSAAYVSSKSATTSIPDAIRQIGCAAVGRIAAAIAVIEAMPESLDDGFNPIRAWQHSFAVAQLCQRLAPKGEETGGVAYLVGLCHDLGDILFHARFGAEHRAVLEAHRTTGRPIAEVERALLGVTRAELLPVVLSKVGLPETIRTPILEFHATTGRSPAAPLARILWMAELYANGMLLAASESAAVAPLTRATCLKGTGQADPECPDADVLRGEVFCLTSMLARLSPRDDASLATPLLPRRGVRLWLTRDRSLSAFDPLAAALGALAAEVHVTDRLPSLAEADRFDALVVAACSASGTPGLKVAEIQSAPGGNSGHPPLWLTTAVVAPGQPGPAPLPISLADLDRFTGGVEAHMTRRAA